MIKKTAIIVDDETAGIDQLERMLGYCDGIEIIGKCGVPEKAIELITHKKPDILFLDVEMPRVSGFEILEITRNQGLEPLVIFTTGYSQYAIKAIKEQAFDYLLKPIILDELKITLKRISNHDLSHSFPLGIAKLISHREREILDLVIQGKTSKEIGTHLFISKTTVDTHRRNILEKTGAKSTAELMSKMLI